MFTGIIEGLGTLKTVRSAGEGSRFTISSDFALDGTKLGDSIAVNGACLTAVVLKGNLFEVDVAPETLLKTTFGGAKPGSRVNLERALRLGGRLDGHLVSGHIDGVGIISQKKPIGNAVIVTIKIPENLLHYMIQKGSVAIDGISLTINECGKESFDISIIPHTAKLTSIGFKNVGDKVNIETDMIGKYIERFVEGFTDTKQKPIKQKLAKQSPALDINFLAKAGFL